jgi:hypothetical protein
MLSLGLAHAQHEGIRLNSKLFLVLLNSNLEVCIKYHNISISPLKPNMEELESFSAFPEK